MWTFVSNCVCAFLHSILTSSYIDVVFFCGAFKRKNNIYFIYLEPIKNVHMYVYMYNCVFCADTGCNSSPSYFILVHVAQGVLRVIKKGGSSVLIQNFSNTPFHLSFRFSFWQASDAWLLHIEEKL